MFMVCNIFYNVCLVTGCFCNCNSVAFEYILNSDFMLKLCVVIVQPCSCGKCF